MQQITPEKFSEVYNTYNKRLFVLSEKIVKDDQRTEDVVQEVFMRLHKQDYSKIQGHLEYWLMTVCRNQSIRSYNKRKRFSFFADMETGEMFENIDETLSQSDSMIRQELVTELIKIVENLAPKQKMALTLRYFHDMTYNEVAEKMNSKSQNVAFLLNDAIANIRKRLDAANILRKFY